jgi:hypothetical protein
MEAESAKLKEERAGFGVTPVKQTKSGFTGQAGEAIQRV